MGFAPGPGQGGNSSIAGSTDVALNSPQNNHVLTYDGDTSKWKNATNQDDVSDAVKTNSPNMQLDYGTELPAAGNEGRFFIVIPS